MGGGNRWTYFGIDMIGRRLDNGDGNAKVWHFDYGRSLDHDALDESV
jgi:hypothetical protein